MKKSFNTYFHFNNSVILYHKLHFSIFQDVNIQKYLKNFSIKILYIQMKFDQLNAISSLKFFRADLFYFCELTFGYNDLI